MSILHGEVTEVDEKVSKKGKKYQRLNITNDAGVKAWWTSFARTQAKPGDVITAAVKPMGDGEIIDDFTLDAGSVDNAQAASHYEPQSAPVQGPALDMRQLSIEMQCFWKGLLDKGKESPYDCMLGAYKLATVSAKIAAGGKAGGIEGLAKAIRSYDPSEPDSKAREVAEREQAKLQAEAEIEARNHSDNTDVAGPEHTQTAADDPGFDDDIPF